MKRYVSRTKYDNLSKNFDDLYDRYITVQKLLTAEIEKLNAEIIKLKDELDELKGGD